MIEVRDLKFRYHGARDNVLDGVSFSVRSGECIAIVGKNGSGKSTLGRILAGLTKFRAGTVTIGGLPPQSQSIGIVFQNPENQIIFSNIRDELSFALKNLPDNKINRLIDSALAKVDMLEFKERNLYELSLGQKQRIMIAEALVMNAKYLILDEPTTMIDSRGKEKIHAIIRKLQSSGCTILLLTNSADEILLADRTLILERGKIAHEIPRTELLKKSAVLEKSQITLPTILQIAKSLQAAGIRLELQDFTVAELTKCLSTRIRHD